MRTSSPTVLAMVLAGLTAACAARPKFEPTKPVEIEPYGLLGKSAYKQDGKYIDADDMLAQLASLEATRADVRSANRWRWTVLALGVPGLTALTYGIWGRDELFAWRPAAPARWALLGAGVALCGGTVYAAVKADGYVRRAVETHNGRFAQPAASIAPWLASIPDVAGRERIAIGTSIGF